MAQTLKENLSVKSTWIRLIFMILYGIVVYFIIFPLIWLIAAFQFIYSLFVGKANQALLPFNDSLGQYVHQIVAFLTYITEEKPFPFTSWPAAGEETKEKTKEEETKKVTAKKPEKKKE